MKNGPTRLEFSRQLDFLHLSHGIHCRPVNPRCGGNPLNFGAALNIRCMTQEDARTYLLSAIWKEQVTDLLPVVFEMGYLIASCVVNEIGSDWLDDCDESIMASDGRVILEPAEVIDLLKKSRRIFVPKSIWTTLTLLRSTRNELAHMRPIDHGRIREVWQKFDYVRHRFG